MKPASAKAKGRRLQQEVRRDITSRLGLEEDDVRSTSMGASGEDVLLSPAARRVFPFAVECKNQERLNVWEALKQAEANGGGHAPLLIFKRNRGKTYAALEWVELLDLLVELAHLKGLTHEARVLDSR